MNRTRPFLFGLWLALAAVAIAPQAASAQAWPPQTNRAGQVTVKVTPLEVSDKGWRFEVVLDTHSVALTQALPEIASIVDGAGAEHRPVDWEGDPPGGHHRKGVLVFEPGPPAPGALVMTIRNVGPVAERTFRWVVP